MSVEYREEYRGVCCQYFKTCLTLTEFYRVPWSFRRYLGGFRRYLGGFCRYLRVHRGLYVSGVPGSTGEYRGGLLSVL